MLAENRSQRQPAAGRDHRESGSFAILVLPLATPSVSALVGRCPVAMASLLVVVVAVVARTRIRAHRARWIPTGRSVVARSIDRQLGHGDGVPKSPAQGWRAYRSALGQAAVVGTGTAARLSVQQQQRSPGHRYANTYRTLQYRAAPIRMQQRAGQQARSPGHAE
ncbi:uncharacterized protein PSFLO_03767 [Pseudozyma flocculosa]|uniref:Uncharacterized protein n=1 Tax=Pseudozyma flocculosa TaxID=84751 RepID=A0A5C3F2H8_9BASI|nr:uncharacterized protein PSFLO_03767 [Pseudozyma flocculosa]